MSSGENGKGDTNPGPDFAKAFQEIARGERAAAALENQLNSLEQKIEELLAKANEDEQKTKEKSVSKQTEDKMPMNGQNNDAA